MSAFSAANIEKALHRVPSMATKDLRQLLERAEANGIADLAARIRAELAVRGSVEFDATAAKRHADWSNKVADADLAKVIVIAFREVPINADERQLTQHIARNPGVGHQELIKLRGKGDVGLILGHMVYERLGFFRKFLDGSEKMSNLLFLRDDSSGRMHYLLTKEAQQSFAELQII